VKLLAATDFSTRSHRALRRAGLLAQARGAELALVHVVDDDQPKDLVAIEKREAERILAEQISAMPELCDAQCCPSVVAGDPFDGILRTAASVQADLIVMGAHRKQLLRDIFVGTTIERVIRTGPYPVLMVNDKVKQPYRNALAAIDMSEASANAIRTAQTTGLIGDGGVALVRRKARCRWLGSIELPSTSTSSASARRPLMNSPHPSQQTSLVVRRCQCALRKAGPSR
jgi:universal stress protein E